MGVPGNADLLLLKTAAAAGGYQVSRSLRFDGASSAFLSRTPASTGSRRTYTFSCWIKRSTVSDTWEPILYVPSGSAYTFFGFLNQKFYLQQWDGGSTTFETYTTQVFRDPGQWYHIVFAVDTTQATGSNRFKLYVNGSQVTTFDTANYGSQNLDTYVNLNSAHYIGNWFGNNHYLDAYLAECHFIDGSAKVPGDFAETDATTGQWIPKLYSGSYGTNGFKLNFADNSAATAAALGKDTSGNSNNWTPNNFYVSNTVYSSGVSITGSYANNTNARMAFDGSISTKLEMSGSNNQITFTPPAAISFSSTVEVYLTPTGDVTYTRYSFNNGADTAFSAGDGWKTVASGGGTFASLVLKQGAQSNNIGFAAIRINGSTILVDASSADNDSLVDTPTSVAATDTGIGGEIRGNYCTLNPLIDRYNIGSSGTKTFSEGNLKITATTGDATRTRYLFGTIGISSGKWYYEMTVDDNAGGLSVGFAPRKLADDDFTYQARYTSNGTISINGTTYSSLATYTTGDIIGIALDLNGNTVQFYKNNTAIGSAYSLTGGIEYLPLVLIPAIGTSSTSATFNFGQRAFSYQAPSGYKCLVDTNLPSPVIAKPSTVMDVKLYTGNGSTQSISGLGFSPDFVWIKDRSQGNGHGLFDVIRGATKGLFSNLTNAEITDSNSLTSFDSTGFSTGSGGTTFSTNINGNSYVAWAWDGGTTTASNGSGSITSSVRANASAGFSIVSFNSGSNGQYTIGHGLGVAPALILCKARDSALDWQVFHVSATTTVYKYFWLNATQGVNTDASKVWGDNLPTSTVFGFSTGNNQLANKNIICYCFSPVAGYSAMGSYVGNGSSTSGPFVYLGFRPRFLLVKSSTGAENWDIYDSSRGSYNLNNLSLQPNLSGAEYNAGSLGFDFLSNGFRSIGGSNTNGATYIYFAVAESPFAYSRAR